MPKPPMIDSLKILKLKAKVFDLMGTVEFSKKSIDDIAAMANKEIEVYQLSLDEAMKEIGELNKQINEQNIK